MTTTISVSVGGDYKAKVTGTKSDGSMINDELIGGSAGSVRSYSLGGHPASGTFTVYEEALTDEEKATRNARANPAGNEPKGI